MANFLVTLEQVGKQSKKIVRRGAPPSQAANNQKIPASSGAAPLSGKNSPMSNGGGANTSRSEKDDTKVVSVDRKPTKTPGRMEPKLEDSSTNATAAPLPTKNVWEERKQERESLDRDVDQPAAIRTDLAVIDMKSLSIAADSDPLDNGKTKKQQFGERGCYLGLGQSVSSILSHFRWHVNIPYL